jgi:hypothetical protein
MALSIKEPVNETNFTSSIFIDGKKWKKSSGVYKQGYTK